MMSFFKFVEKPITQFLTLEISPLVLLLIVGMTSISISISLSIIILITNSNKFLLPDTAVPLILAVVIIDNVDGNSTMKFMSFLLLWRVHDFLILSMTKCNSSEGDNFTDGNDGDDSSSSLVIVVVKSLTVSNILSQLLMKLICLLLVWIQDHANPYRTVLPGINLDVTIVGFEIEFDDDDDDDDDSNWRNILIVLFFPVIHVNQQILM